jgi:hybrid cluster-associated redox disulfide protein
MVVVPSRALSCDPHRIWDTGLRPSLRRNKLAADSTTVETFQKVAPAQRAELRRRYAGAHVSAMNGPLSMQIAVHMTVDEVMRRWPATIRVFLDHRMRCVGCPIASFHTIDDACREHGLDRTAFVAVLYGEAA